MEGYIVGASSEPVNGAPVLCLIQGDDEKRVYIPFERRCWNHFIDSMGGAIEPGTVRVRVETDGVMGTEIEVV